MRKPATIAVACWAMLMLLGPAGLDAVSLAAPIPSFVSPSAPIASFVSPSAPIPSFAPPAAPSGLTAAVLSPTRIRLAWVDNADNELFFKLQRRSDGGNWTGIFLPMNTQVYADSGLPPGEHCYRIRSHTRSEWSAYAVSTPACITLGGGPPPPSPPATPSNLVPTVISANRINLSWTDNAADEINFQLQRAAQGGTWSTIANPGLNQVAYFDRSVTSGTWCYRIRARNAAGFSSFATSTPTCVDNSGGGPPPPPPPTGPPAAPNELLPTLITADRINLSWSDNSNNEINFQLQRAPQGGTWSTIANPGQNQVAYHDTSVTVGSWCYRIRARNAQGFSTFASSNPVCINNNGGGGGGSGDPPAAPSNLVPTVISTNQINLSWNDNSDDEINFQLQRAPQGGVWSTIANPGQDQVAYHDTSVTSGSWCYRIRSRNADGFSSFASSNPVCISTSGGGGGSGPPAAPSNLVSTVIATNQISLSWNDNSSDEQYFQLQRAPQGGIWGTIANPTANQTNYSDTAVSSGSWCYRIRARNASGWSSFASSSPVCISTVGALPAVRTVPVVTSGLVQPVFLTAPFGDNRLFIVERRGLIRIIENGVLLAEPFLDITDRTKVLGEGGLLGLAFAPDYATSGLFYVDYTDNDPDENEIGDTKISRFQVSGDPDVADAASEEVLLTIVQPFRNHNGGTVAFGLDGYLYIGMGDGGSGNDPGNRAQNDASIHGKMLRIDVGGGLGSGYSIPPDNPDPSGSVWLPETWSKGWRNPYRFSFDRVMGDMYVGDVGQVNREEVSVEPMGAGGRNYGWRLMEGFACKIPGTNCNDGSLTLPVYDYGHVVGRCSVTGGYVYRGGAIPKVYGHYFFADFCSGEVFSFVWDGAGGYSQFADRTAELSPAGGLGLIAGFGEDGFGELYIIDMGGRIFKIVAGS